MYEGGPLFFCNKIPQECVNHPMNKDKMNNYDFQAKIQQIYICQWVSCGDGGMLAGSTWSDGGLMAHM